MLARRTARGARSSQIPVLEVEEDGRTLRLVQSMAILEWLEERFPDAARSSPPTSRGGPACARSPST